MARPDQLIVRETSDGLPLAEAIITVPNCLEKKKACNCRIPSNNHSVASANCSVLQPSGRVHARGGAATAAVGAGSVASRPGVSLIGVRPLLAHTRSLP